MSEQEPRALRRELGPASSVLMTAGAMIGTGIFVAPLATARGTGSGAAMLGLWVIGALLSLLGALSFAEAGAAIPETGGLAVYLRRAFGDWAAFAFGWAMLTVLVPSSLAFFAQVAHWHLRDAGLFRWRWSPDVIIAALWAINVAGLRWGSALQSALTLVKVIGVVGMSVFLCSTGGAALETTASPVASPGALDFAAAIVPVLWAYDGWIDVTSVAGEVRDPKRTVPLAVVVGTLLVAALYLLVNGALLVALPHSALGATREGVTLLALGPFGAPWARASLAALVAIAAVGSAAVGLLSGVRVVFAVAQQGLLFAPLGRVSSTRVPAASLTTCAVIALAYLHSPLGRLGEVFVLGAWPFYALGALGIIRLRRAGLFDEPLGGDDRGGERFRTPCFPLPQWAFALLSVAIVLVYAVREPRHTMISLGVLAFGFALYPWFARSRRVAS